MRTKILLVSLVTLAITLALLSAVTAQIADNVNVKVNDLWVYVEGTGPVGSNVSVRAGETISVKVTFTANESADKVRVKAELEGDMGDSHMGLQARLMSQALRKLTSIVHKSKTVLVFINQIRQNISSMAWGNKETTTGGNALKFYSSLRLDVRRIASLKKGEEQFGNRVAIKVVKNKMAPPFKKVELDLLFSEGISRELELLDVAVGLEIVTQSGSWFAYKNEKLAQGREQVLNLLKQDKKMANDIEKQIIEVMAKNNEAGL